MNIQMIGIDFHMADIEKREPISFTQNQVLDLLPKFKKNQNVISCALLATCNRTELYINSNSNIDIIDLFSSITKINKNDYHRYSVVRNGKEAIKHLMEVSSGLQSQILGDDQILTQVKTAMKLAREAGTLDNVLETMFRRCITAGKKVKTETNFYKIPPSASAKSVNMAQNFFGSLIDKKAVVIGNGEMGRLTAKLLVERGCDVTVTLRTYRHGQTIIPAGCKTHDYNNRFECIEGVDMVCSATASPHCTITYDEIIKLNKIPKLFIDLAMPRDIDTKMYNIKNTTVWNLDNLSDIKDENIYDKIKADKIIQKEISDFYEWSHYMHSIPIISNLKENIIKRIKFDKSYKEIEKDCDLDYAVEVSVNKAVDLMLNGMKDIVNPDRLSDCLEHIRKGF